MPSFPAGDGIEREALQKDFETLLISHADQPRSNHSVLRRDLGMSVKHYNFSKMWLGPAAVLGAMPVLLGRQMTLGPAWVSLGPPKPQGWAAVVTWSLHSMTLDRPTSLHHRFVSGVPAYTSTLAPIAGHSLDVSWSLDYPVVVMEDCLRDLNPLEIRINPLQVLCRDVEGSVL